MLLKEVTDKQFTQSLKERKVTDLFQICFANEGAA